MGAIALTDHGSMYGVIEFYKKCKASDIKPIIGVEAYVANRSRFQKEPGIDNKRYHLTLLAKDTTGYRNLIKMVTKANLEGFYYKPRMDKELLIEHHEGIICLSGCMGSELSRLIWNKDYAGAEKLALEYQEIFGKENYFIEIMHHPKIERALEIKEELIKLARKLNIPLVATQDSHYLCKDDAKAHDTLVAINTHFKDGDRKISNIEEDFSFASPEAMAEAFSEAPEALENTLKIADMVNIELELGKWVFPVFPIPEGSTYPEELGKQARAAVVEYIKENPERKKEAMERMEYELEVITKKGYDVYFLVVSDLINHAHEKGIFTNTRGSAAGSFVSYLIGITGVDPLLYKLPFERFLNAERPSPPDIDMDYADKRREEILDYAKEKYGVNKVAQIGTFGSMMAKGAVRDVARALGHPYATGDKISSLIPLGSQGFAMTIDRAMDMEPELKKMYESDPVTTEIIDLAKKIEGCARHISVHAAGVVIAPTDITDFVPVQLDPKGGKIITQYDMHDVEDAGLLKYDFLGIRNLSILEDSIKIVKKTTGKEINIDKIPLDDTKTYEMLARGETIGLFQLNGAGMTKWLKELKPTSIYDINAMVALYRPGPMESIPEYIRRKYNNKLVRYLDPRMKSILDQSYGVITYQDDVMLIAINLAGYSWTEADKLRKAMGKKIPKEMAAQKEKLVEGLAKHGMSEAKIAELWSLIEPFAAYGFNKAHAASYGRVAYQTSYMKANFPAEYMTAVLSAESGDTEEIASIIAECKKMTIPVLPPDINESYGDFATIKAQNDTDQDKIRFGLFTIKNLGAEIASAIVAERKANGPFTSYTEFLDRVRHKNLNRKSLEALIKAGAMDSFGTDRGVLMANIEESLEYNKEGVKANTDQSSLFGLMSDTSTVPTLKLKPAEPVSVAERLAWEKELLGLYISGHPLDRCKDKFEKEENTIRHNKQLADGKEAVIAGIIEEVKKIYTKKGDLMAFVRLADYTGAMECVFFSRTFEQFKNFLEPDRCLVFKGKISIRNNETSMLVEAVKEL